MIAEPETTTGEFEYCPHCGMPNSKTTEFCDYCGKKLDSQVESDNDDHIFPEHER